MQASTKAVRSSSLSIGGIGHVAVHGECDGYEML